MSVASIDYAIDEAAVQDDHDVVDLAVWLDRKASLRRQFTRYEPRHRADGPAV